ncbi:MAG: LCP family protein [Acidimicrobiales bacterium]
MPDVPYDGEVPDPDPYLSWGELNAPVAQGPAGSSPDLSGGAAGTAAASQRTAASQRRTDSQRKAGKRAATTHGRSRRPRPPKRRRWTRRALIAGGVVVLLIVAIGLGGYFYLDYQFHQIKRVDVPNLAPHTKPGAPFTVLVAGSDSRSFVNNSSQCKAFGCGADTGGQRSDVIILVRVVPAAHQIEMLSIPRDTWVTIPGNVQYISGQNRINAAFNSGPSLLVQTIAQDFHIPVNYFVEVNFPGLQNMVNAIGGIHLHFTDPLRDREYVNGQATNPTGLRILKTGCQVVNGNQALALVRSRNLQYELKGVWYNDYGSDFTRIRNQQAFFRAVIHQLNAEIINPIALTGFISAAVHNLTIDQTMTEGTMVNLAREFHNFPPGSLKSVTFPTVGPYVTSGGADVLLPAATADDVVIKNFLAFGTHATTTPTTTTPGSSTASTTGMTSTPESLAWSAILAGVTSTTTPAGAPTTTTTSNQTTVTTIAPTPAGEAPIYNNAPAPWDPTTC